jgi:dienelactone hydrolase
MTTILLFHHAQGLTPGVLAFADELRQAGHTVHTPDLYEGRTFDTLDEGMAHAGAVGFGALVERGLAVAETLPADLVYAGFSLGVMPAQRLAQTRPGARGALLYSAAIPLDEFGGAWPDGVPVQFHVMENDELGDVDVAKALAGEIPDAELFLYPGSAHLFADSSLPAFTPDAAALLTRRALELLARVG